MPEMPVENGKLLLRSLFRRAAEMRQPVSGTFEITSRCNLDCGMCYIRKPAGDADARREELSTRDWVKLAREAVDNGMIFLLLTGGEALLRPDFFDIYEPLTYLGLRISLFSNGNLITREMARRLGQRPPGRMEISLYGATRLTYERVTRVPGSYEACLVGIENLLAEGIRPVIKVTVTQSNIGEIEAIQDKVRSWNLPVYAGWLLSPPRQGACNELDQFRASIPESVALEQAYPENTMVFGATQAICESSNEGSFYCDAGRNSFVISASGAMNVCLDLCLPALKPMEIGFAEAWRQLGRFVESVPTAPYCSSCELEPDCPRCPAWSYATSGSFTEPVPYLCEIAVERRRRRGSGTGS